MDEQMRQVAPYPTTLADLVARLTYRPGWTFHLRDEQRDDRGTEAGLTFTVTTEGYDSYHTDRGETYRVRHLFPVPPATYDARSWQRWLLDRLLEVERHEACEFFAFEVPAVDGLVGAITGREERHVVRPYAPSHGPGNDPYLIREVGTDLDRRTRYTGEVSDT